MAVFSASNSLDVIGNQVVTGGLSIGPSFSTQGSESTYGLTISSAPLDKGLSTFTNAANGSYVSALSLTSQTVILTPGANLTISEMNIAKIDSLTLKSTASSTVVTHSASMQVNLPVVLATDDVAYQGKLTVTNLYGIKINTQGTNNTTNAYGLHVSAPTGATNNYALYVNSGESYFGGISNIANSNWAGGTNFIRLAATGNYSEQSIVFQEVGPAVPGDNNYQQIGAKIGVKNPGYGAYDIIFANRITGSYNSTMTERMRIHNSGKIIIGYGEGTATLAGNTLRGPSGVGPNIAGGSLTIAGGESTGNAAGGSVIFQTAPNAGPGSTGNALVERMQITSSGKVGIGTSDPGTTLEVYGSITARPASTNDAVIIAGRAGGTAGYSITLVSGTLTSNKTLTLPDTTGTLALKADTLYIGTTSVALNRASAALTLTGITSVSFPSGPTYATILQGSASATAGVTYTLPAADGTSGQALVTGGNGTLSWATASGGGGTTTNALTIGTGLSGTSSTFNGSAANTISLNVGNANTWTAAQKFNAGITINNPSSTSLFTFQAFGSTVYSIESGSSQITHYSYASGGSVPSQTWWFENIAGTTVTKIATLTVSGLAVGGSHSPQQAIDIKGVLRLNGTTANTNYTQLQSAATPSTNMTYTFPATAPSAGQILSSDANGNLSWVANSAGASLSVANTWTATQTFSNGTYSALFTGGSVGIGTASPGTALEVYGSITARPASTNDAVIIAGRAGGTSSYGITLLSGTLSASRTLTLPDVTGTLVTTGDTGTVTSTMLSGSIGNAKLSNSSVTVNGSSISLGGSATVTANTTNALTIGTGLSGTASTFDGSAANTISLNVANANTWTAIQTFSNGTYSALFTGGSVGIGTATPGSALDVKGTLRLSGSTSGYVGFAPAAAAGSTTYTLPSADGASGYVLQTNGGGILSWVASSGGGGGASLSVANTWTAGQTFSGGLTISAATTDVYATLTNTASGGRSWIINATSTGSGEGSGRLLFKDATASATRMTIDSSGNVGIGTIGPGSALDVKGTLRLSGSTSGYVGFAPAAAAGSITYTLPSADGASSQVLQTSGGGILSWATPRRVYSIPASAFTVTATNPATFQAVGTSNASSGSNASGGAFYELSFADTSTTTSADVVLRASAHALDGNQTMAVKLVWYSSATSGAVRWAWDYYSGTTSNVVNGGVSLLAATTATVNATTLRHNITALTTLVGSNVPLEDSLVTLRISRLGADGADTLIATANVIAVYVEFT